MHISSHSMVVMEAMCDAKGESEGAESATCPNTVSLHPFSVKLLIFSMPHDEKLAVITGIDTVKRCGFNRRGLVTIFQAAAATAARAASVSRPLKAAIYCT